MLLEKLFGTEGKIKILRELFRSEKIWEKKGAPEAYSSLTDLGKSVDMSVTGVMKTVFELSRMGLVDRITKGRMTLVRLKKDNYYADILEDLFGWESTVEEEVLTLATNYAGSLDR